MSLQKTLDKLEVALSQASEKDRAEALQELEALRALTEAERADIRRTSSVAEDFMRGIDLISNVMMTLVLKFGRATTMLIGVLLGMWLGIVLFVIALVTSYGLHRKIEVVVESQSKIHSKQEELNRNLEKVLNHPKSGPRVVVVKETGRAKLVLPVDPNDTETGSHEVEIPLDLVLLQ